MLALRVPRAPDAENDPVPSWEPGAHDRTRFGRLPSRGRLRPSRGILLAPGTFVGFPADLRYSARSFLRTPGLTAALLLTIALGIGSNASVYGFVRGLIVRDSPLTETDRFVSLFGRNAHREASPVSYEEYLALAGERTAFEWLGAARESQSTIMRGDR